MAETLTRYDLSRWGPEATPANPPASGFKIVPSLSVAFSPEAVTDEFVPAGYAVPTVISQDRELVRLALEGRGDYAGIVYPFSAAYGSAVITTPGGGILSRDWDWDVPVTSEPVPKTFTLERGQASYALRSRYVSLSTLGIEWGRGPATVNGNGFGRAIETGISLTTTGLTTLATIPMVGKHVQVFLDDTAAGLGVTLLTRVKAGRWEYGTGRDADFYVNSAANGFVHTSDGESVRGLNLVVQSNSTGWALLTNWQAGTTKFLRLEWVGPIIEGALTYLVRIDTAVKLNGNPTIADTDRVQTIAWPLTVTHDPTWNAAIKIKVRNTLTAL